MYKSVSKLMLGLGLATLIVGCNNTDGNVSPSANPPSNNIPTVRLYATAGNQLVSFSSGTPGTLLSNTTINGLQLGETIVGLDFRPATNTLVALGSSSRVYNIDKVTGAATAVNATAFTPGLNGTAFGADFNPVVDRFRVVSNAGQNLRVNPTTGAATADTNLAYASTDAGNTTAPRVVAVAYNNNVAGTNSTTLFGIDSGRDALVLQNPPNAGTLTTLGALNFDTDDRVGFDMDGNNNAFVSLTANVAGTTQSDLFFVRPDNLQLTPLGKIGGAVVTSLTIER